MEDLQTLKDEKLLLDEKILKLEITRYSSEWNCLKQYDQDLLIRQIEYMEFYSLTLGQRIDNNKRKQYENLLKEKFR